MKNKSREKRIKTTKRVIGFAKEFIEDILNGNGYDWISVPNQNGDYEEYLIIQREKGVRYGLFSLEEVAEWIDHVLYNYD